MMGSKGPMDGMDDIMSKMMGQGGPMGDGGGMPMMDMMSKMMPRGLAMMLDKLPKEQRVEFAKEMVAVIVEKGCEGLSKEERDQFFDDLVISIRPEKEED